MDEIDLANSHSEMFQTLAMNEHRRNRESENNSDTECEDCGEEIPLKRRLARPGCRRCIACQETYEIHHWRAL